MPFIRKVVTTRYAADGQAITTTETIESTDDVGPGSIPSIMTQSWQGNSQQSMLPSNSYQAFNQPPGFQFGMNQGSLPRNTHISAMNNQHVAFDSSKRGLTFSNANHDHLNLNSPFRSPTHSGPAKQASPFAQSQVHVGSIAANQGNYAKNAGNAVNQPKQMGNAGNVNQQNHFMGKTGNNQNVKPSPTAQYSPSRQSQKSPTKSSAPPPAAAQNSSQFKPMNSMRNKAAQPSEEFLKLKDQLVSTKTLYEDPDFPACDSSLYYSRRPPRPIQWLRPTEIASNPEFVTGGASRFDVQQGELGDCWLLAAVASLSIYNELLNNVVPSDQNFRDNYCGMFRFRFWRFGEWKDIIVDDRLPTFNRRLVYMHSSEMNEFWTALLEKAYAKLFGSYEALKGGSSSEAMEDFTGGITEYFELRGQEPANLYDIILQAQKRCSLMGCSMEPDPRVVEAQLPNGLIMGHAYSVTDVKMVRLTTGQQVPLLRIRNPWGNEAEWKGPWGDKSHEWKKISDAERHRVGLSFDDDGEFWMSYQDFVSNFDKLEICHLGPQSMDEDATLSGKPKTKWEMCLENGKWKKRVSAGGCRNYIKTFWTNPQFRVTVVDADDDDDENMGTVIIGLMQKDMRKKRKEGAELNTIGYVIYRINDPNSDPLDMNFFKYNASVAKSPQFINTREVCGRHKLEPALYCIIPSTFEPDEEGDFLLRIFSEKPNDSGELDQDIAFNPVEPPRELSATEDIQDKALQEAFKQIAGDDMEVDAYELMDILNAVFMTRNSKGPLSMNVSQNEFDFSGFQIETCRSMVAMKDIDRSGKLGYNEFTALWNDIRVYKNTFLQFDTDHTGNFDSFQLRRALQSIGFSVNNDIFNSLVMRYASQNGKIEFDEFVLCCIRFKTIFITFDAQDKDSPSLKDGEAIFPLNTFMRAILYA